MLDPWVLLVLIAGAVVAAGLYFMARRPRPVVFGDAREERLTGQLARLVGCSLAQALPAVRREVGMAPNQSDATLLKRAVYHYRQEIPETPGLVYRDPQPG
jgi:hypothetical protein